MEETLEEGDESGPMGHTTAQNLRERYRQGSYKYAMVFGKPYCVTIKEDGSQLQVGFRMTDGILRLVDVRSKAKRSIGSNLNEQTFEEFQTNHCSFQSIVTQDVLDRNYWTSVTKMFTDLQADELWLYHEQVPNKKTPCGITYEPEDKGCLYLFEVAYTKTDDVKETRMYSTPENTKYWKSLGLRPVRVVKSGLLSVDEMISVLQMLRDHDPLRLEGLMFYCNDHLTKLKLHHATDQHVKFGEKDRYNSCPDDDKHLKVFDFYNECRSEIDKERLLTKGKKPKEKTVKSTNDMLLHEEINKNLSYLTPDQLLNYRSAAVDSQKSYGAKLAPIIKAIKTSIRDQDPECDTAKVLDYLVLKLREI